MTLDFRSWHPEQKARFVAVLFAIIGIAAWLALERNVFSFPLALFYAVITINTYFSVRFFSGLMPSEDALQHVLDVVLAIFFLLLALHFAHPIIFVFFALCLFIAATLKYALLIHTFAHPIVLRRKILIDLLGIILCAVILGLMLAGAVFYATWAFALIFLAANAHLLILRPMYRQ